MPTQIANTTRLQLSWTQPKSQPFPPPLRETKLLVLSRARLDSRRPDLAEPVRGRPDAGARGGTQRKQHLDEDPPRAPLRRAPELPQQHRRQLDSRFFLNMTRIA